MTPVEFQFFTPDGLAIPAADFEVQLAQSSFIDGETGIIMPRTVTGTTDATGRQLLSLRPSKAPYYVTMYDPASDAELSYKFYVPLLTPPTTQVRLQDLVVEGPVSNTTYDEAALAAIADTKAVVMAAQVDAANSKTTAANSASAAAGSASAALGSKNAAATSASNALTSEQHAKTSEDNAKQSETNASTIIASSVRVDTATQNLTAQQKTNAKTNLALQNVDNTSDVNKPVSTAQQNALNLKANLASPTFTGTVGGITAAMVGLGSVNNTSDAAKPVSTAQQTALDLKANLASPTFTGVPAVPTAAVGTNTTQAASTQFVKTEIANVIGAAPTTLDTLNELAAALGNDANFATTTATALGNRLRVDTAAQGLTGTQQTNAKTNLGLQNVDNTSDINKPVSTAQQNALNLKAPLASPALTGTPTVPTPVMGTANTTIANTAFVNSEKEYLASLASVFHQGAIVDTFLYDTGRDSDGGAWRKRCKHTTWYNEPLCSGDWLGQAANELQARGDNLFWNPETINLWSNNGSTITTNYGLTPEGNKASLLISAGTRFYSVGSTMITGGLYCYMQIVKAGTGTATRLYMDNTGGVSGGATFTFATESFSSLNANVKATGFKKLTSDGWYMIWMYFTAVSTTGAYHCYPVQGSVEYWAAQLRLIDVDGTAAFDNSPPVYMSYAALAGRYYQDTSDGKFYKLNTTYGNPIQVYRGNKTEFPAVALIVAEAARVVIYDATRPTFPMWMSFEQPSLSTGILGWASSASAGVVSSIHALNGILAIGTTVGAAGLLVNFVADKTTILNAAPFQLTQGQTVGDRNSITAFSAGGDGIAIVGSVVYDISMTVLPDAPVDPRSGLLVPTVAVATASGVSIIKHDGTVVNDTATGGATRAATTVEFTRDGRLIRNFGTDYRRLGIYTGGGNKIPVASASLDSNWDIFGDLPTNRGAPYTPALSVNRVVATRDYIALAYSGLTMLKHNPSSRASSMLAYINNAYTTGWMVGDVRGAWLSDITTETLTSPELVVNGTFDTNSTGWSVSNATIAVTAGVARVTNTTSNTEGFAYQYVPTVPGRVYALTCTPPTGSASAYVNVGEAGAYLGAITTGKNRVTFTAVSNSTRILLRTNVSNSITAYGDFDNISMKLVEMDYGTVINATNNVAGLSVVGTLNKAPIAAGSQLVGYSGFSATNYLEQPYNANFDFGTGDFCVMGWFNIPDINLAYRIFERNTPALTDVNKRLILIIDVGGSVKFYCGGAAQTTATVSTGLHHFCGVRISGTVYLYIDGVLANTGAATADLTYANAITRLGQGITATTGSSCTMALWKIGVTAPSADQVAQIYRDELQLFQAGAQCTLDGSSFNVTALAYDDATDLLHVGTSWGRSAFHGLQRIESAATSVGGVQAISALNGMHITGGSTGARYAQPAITLRDEFRNKHAARQAMQREEIPVDFDGTAGVTTFQLPYGMQAKNVYVAGAVKRPGATKDYYVTSDGYRESVVFGTSPGAVWVRITANRSI